MPRVVFDTVIFVRALLNPHSVCGRLIFQFAESYTPIVSEPLLREVFEVLHRPELVRRFRRLVGVSIERAFEILEAAERVEVVDIPAVSRDPKDDHVLATALAACADYAISRDNDLLVLGAYHGSVITTAAAFLGLLEAQIEDAHHSDGP